MAQDPSSRLSEVCYGRLVRSNAGDESDVNQADLVRRQREDLQNAFLRGAMRLHWSADRLAAERQRLLRDLLLLAADRSPFWRARLAGRDLETFTEADLPSLPVLTRAEMMGEFDRLITVPGIDASSGERASGAVGFRPLPRG